jgi:hypothetical protein
MIHIIPHHIHRGSWPKWYEFIYFKENVNFLNGYDVELIERDLERINHVNLLEERLSKIDIQKNDCVFLDKKYFTNGYDTFDEIEIKIINKSKKYNCKFFIIDDDNQYEYIDTDYFTIFSNRFKLNKLAVNFNYFRYRFPNHTWSNSISNLLEPFLTNLRQKKINFFAGVDKIERLQVLKHIHNIGLNLDSYTAYSGFSKSYIDDDISDNLIKFRDSVLPIILDIPYERSLVGDVNVEIPSFPICLNSYISCICETSIICSDEIHLSEKAWNPFISYNIPLILGSKYINTYLKDLGFWLADDLFDISPKNNKADIINQYLFNLDIINKLSYNEIHEYYIKNKDKINSNFNLLQNQKFIFDRNNYK